MKRRVLYIALSVLVIGLVAFVWWWYSGPKPGKVFDEARVAGRNTDSLPAATADAETDYFRGMDGGISLTSNERAGRITWLVWTGGNDRFWDAISPKSFGALDFLKTLSSYDPSKDSELTSDQREQLKGRYKFTRDNRWQYLGLVNEPCFKKAEGPDPKHFGLWLDQRSLDCSSDPFEDEQKYPGIKIGARGKNLPIGSYYGYATGIIGLRLFPNPAFDEKAAKKWDAERYYTDPKYYNSKDLIKPYRVGMSCAFCHVGPNPINPPDDPENPNWSNLSSNVGAQYFWVDRIFSWEADPSNLIFQLFHTARPGSLDTSLVSTDNISNPRTMNAVYYLGPRLELAKKWGKETLGGGSLDNKQFNDYIKSGPLTEFFQPPTSVLTPHVLKDGADSVGALGALNRVYLNIGLFSEEWMLHFRPLWGGKRVTPIEIRVARNNSAYWGATEAQTPNMALFFLKSTEPHRLRDAPGGSKYLTENSATVARGKVVFAERCARCHSSKFPPPPPDDNPGNCAGPGYLKCWNKYWAWTKTEEFQSEMRKIVLADDFLKDNFLSTDLRVPVTLLHTNACSPLASNGIAGNIWDNFTSQSYKELPSVGAIRYYHPVTGEVRSFQMPAGGRGYTRPASLVSLWSTAPYLLNNAVGQFNPEPSVAARMSSFQSSIEQMLWPEKREKDAILGDKIPGKIDRLTTDTYIRAPRAFLSVPAPTLLTIFGGLFPDFVHDGDLEIGPLPKGLPVDVLANVAVTPNDEQSSRTKKLLSLFGTLKHDLKAIRGISDPVERLKTFDNLSDASLEITNCPDFIPNRGHYFGTDYLEPGATDAEKQELQSEPGLSDSDKKALIAFLKTF